MNTKYFHTLVRKRRARDTVTRTQHDRGSWIEDYGAMEPEALKFYTEIFSFQQGTQANLQNNKDWLRNITLPVLSQQHASSLIALITDAEVKNAFFQMSSFKSPGPDGFLLKQLNQTFITLTPKEDCPTNFKGIRPISLCNDA